MTNNEDITFLKGKKIIIKLGTKVIFDSTSGKIRRDVIQSLARDVAELLKSNNEVIIVSSGAVGCGIDATEGNGSIGVKQARAAVGQIKLMNEYSNVFGEFGLDVAQFLLNKDDLNSDKLDNIKAAHDNLRSKIVPIVNENDVTTTDELTFGDNDGLAVEILEKFDFDVLLVLTNMGALISEGEKILDSNKFNVSDYDSFAPDSLGSGGLETKLGAAKRAVEKGAIFIIAKAGDSIVDILEKKTEGTWFTKV